MITLALLARRRMAELGDAAALTQIDLEIAARGIVDPPRFARLFATWPV